MNGIDALTPALLRDIRMPQDPGGCWIWTGRRLKGYGMARHTMAHRVVYKLLVGPIAEGLELDHLCRTPLCVNPQHLEAVTRLENIRRRYALQRQCANGHPYDESNTYIRPNGHRDCRACIRQRGREYRQRSAS